MSQRLIDDRAFAAPRPERCSTLIPAVEPVQSGTDRLPSFVAYESFVRATDGIKVGILNDTVPSNGLPPPIAKADQEARVQARGTAAS